MSDPTKDDDPYENMPPWDTLEEPEPDTLGPFEQMMENQLEEGWAYDD